MIDWDIHKKYKIGDYIICTNDQYNYMGKFYKDRITRNKIYKLLNIMDFRSLVVCSDLGYISPFEATRFRNLTKSELRKQKIQRINEL